MHLLAAILHVSGALARLKKCDRNPGHLRDGEGGEGGEGGEPGKMMENYPPWN